MNIDYSDQTGIFDPEEFTWPVHLIGMGGIGSAVLHPLLKLGVSELHLWDDDAYESRNIPAQLASRPSDVERYKVDAAAAFAARQETACDITLHRCRVTANTELEGIVICGVDSMASRSEIWNAVKRNGLVPLYMDGRLGGEQLRLLALNPSDPDRLSDYERTLTPDSETSELPCAARTVIHPAVLLAGLMVATLTLHFREEEFPFHVLANTKTMQFFTFK